MALLACGARQESGDLPDEMLWAWRRPEVLTFVDPQRTGVAAWMATIHLAGDSLQIEPREWRLAVPSGTYLAAVVRLESSAERPPDLSPELRSKLSDRLLELWRETGWPELQLDFDARVSEREFYRLLLADLRSGMAGGRLSITALLSWCWEPGWLDDLAVDEVVPMIYRLGPEAELFRRRLAAGEPFVAQACLEAIGVSSDEPIPSFAVEGRKYFFHHLPWTADRQREEQERLANASRTMGAASGSP
ncbi:MAG: hypothetical protein AAF604_16635 [Acidobacteriota bacterium]